MVLEKRANASVLILIISMFMILLFQNCGSNSSKLSGLSSELLADRDQDGLPDEQEIDFGTNENLVDTDGDGLSDGEEALTIGTNPLLFDTDGDGFSDGAEVLRGMNPLVFDGEQPSSDESSVVAPSIIDSDNDGLSDANEERLGTDLNLVDSDSDGLLDGEEVNTFGTDPLNSDTDGDGKSDHEEVSSGSNPLVFDPVPRIAVEFPVEPEVVPTPVEPELQSCGFKPILLLGSARIESSYQKVDSFIRIAHGDFVESHLLLCSVALGGFEQSTRMRVCKGYKREIHCTDGQISEKNRVRITNQFNGDQRKLPPVQSFPDGNFGGNNPDPGFG